MPGSVWNNQYSFPSQACQAYQKAGADKQLCAAVLRTERSTSGVSKEGRGHCLHPKWTIVLFQKNLSVTQRPCVCQETLFHPCPPPIPTNHPFTFNPNSFSLFCHSPWQQRFGCTIQRRRKAFPRYKLEEWLWCPPPTLSPVSNGICEVDSVLPPKHSTCHGSLAGWWKWVCILIFSAPIH